MANNLANVEIGASCIVRVNRKPFLLAEIEAMAPGVEIGPVIFIRLTEAQFRAFRNAGFPVCQKVNRVPQAPPGFTVEFKCVLIQGNEAFLVFDIENATDTDVLVRVSLERAEQLVEQGARRCTVIRRPFDETNVRPDDSTGDRS